MINGAWEDYWLVAVAVLIIVVGIIIWRFINK